MLDPQRIRRAFDRAAPRFGAQDFLHAEIRQRLLDRLPAVAIRPRRILDLGAGNAAATPALTAAYPEAEIVSIDLSAAMLAGARHPVPRVCADAARLPLFDGCTDLILSNLMLHHCPDPAAVLGEMRRALDEGDAEAFRRAAHSLKSNADSFGAARMATLARELEYMGRDGRLDEAGPTLPQLEAAYEEAAEALKARL